MLLLLLSYLLAATNATDVTIDVCKMTCSDFQDSTMEDRNLFLQVAKTCSGSLPITDKVNTHDYESMYGDLLLPYLRNSYRMGKGGVKFLEIGLGCDMRYGPGASLQLWKTLLICPGDDIWFGEYNSTCVEKFKEDGVLEGINTVVGDQGDPSTLKGWIAKSKGDFDVIVDDGGHDQSQIFESFEHLWPTVKKGGLYFIEDLQVANLPQYNRKRAEGYETFLDHINEWTNNKLLGNPLYLTKQRQKASHHGDSDKQGHSSLNRLHQYSMPSDIAAIDVYHESVAIRKCHEDEKGCSR